MIQLDGNGYIVQEIRQCEMELDTLLNMKTQPTNEEWSECVLQAKKSLESALYEYVIRGCDESGIIYGVFPELREQYDPDSNELLDQKIKILSQIAEEGLECDYKNIEGSEDVLENKFPDNMVVFTVY